MKLTTQPTWTGGYQYHIGVNSPYYVNLLRTGSIKYKSYLYCWDGDRILPAGGIDPIITVEKEILNDHSYYFDVSDYLLPYINPQIHTVNDPLDYDLDMKWVALVTQYYRYNPTTMQDEVFDTVRSNQYFASYGFRWNEYTGTNPNTDSSGNIYNIYDGTDKKYKQAYLPTKKNDIGIYFNYAFQASVNLSNNLISYTSFTEAEKTGSQCAYDYQLCFINRYGAFEYFPLYGKVVETTNMTKEHYKSIIPNYGYLQYINYKPEISQSSEIRYSWNSKNIDEVLFLKIEEINHSPLIFMYNTETHKMEQVYIPTNNYSRKTWKNDKRNQTYNIDFVTVMNKKK